MAPPKQPRIQTSGWMKQPIMSAYGAPSFNDLMDATSTSAMPYSSDDIDQELKRRQIASLPEINAPVTAPTPESQPTPPPPPDGSVESANVPDSIQQYLIQLERQRLEREKRLSPYIKAQEGGIKSLEDYVNAQNNVKADIDLSPLMALSDSWFGGNVSKGYRAPASPQELRTNSMKAINALQDQREALTKLATQADPNADYLKFMAIKEKANETNKRADEKKLETFSKDLAKSTEKFNTEVADASGKLNKLEEVYSGGDIKQITSVLGDVAKYIGGNVGATSDPDAARQLYNTMTVKMESWKTKFGLDGKLPEEEVKSMVDLIKRSREISNQIYKNKYSSIRDEYSMRAEAIKRPELMKEGGLGERYIKNLESKVDAGLSSKEDPTISNYAKKYNLPYNSAKEILKEQGYNGK